VTWSVRAASWPAMSSVSDSEVISRLERFYWVQEGGRSGTAPQIARPKGSSGKETRPSGDRQARVRWAPSDGPASDRRPRAQMAPAPSEPRDTTFASRDPSVHRPYGLFAGASDPFVPAQVAHPVTRSGQGRAEREGCLSRTEAPASGVLGCGDPTLAAGLSCSAQSPCFRVLPNRRQRKCSRGRESERPSAARRRARRAGEAQRLALLHRQQRGSRVPMSNGYKPQVLRLLAQALEADSSRSSLVLSLRVDS
jgi:hypothetical protein